MCVCVSFAQVQTAESEAKIVAQYSELVKEAKLQFEREVSSLHPEIQANWKGLSKKHIQWTHTLNFCSGFIKSKLDSKVLGTNTEQVKLKM